MEAALAGPDEQFEADFRAWLAAELDLPEDRADRMTIGEMEDEYFARNERQAIDRFSRRLRHPPDLAALEVRIAAQMAAPPANGPLNWRWRNVEEAPAHDPLDPIWPPEEEEIP